MKIASGAEARASSSNASASGADPWTARTPPDKAATLPSMRAARSASRSTQMARPPCRAHSMAMEPVPPPTSHSSAPGRGPRAATVSSRMGLLVSWPSVSKAVSGSHPRGGPAGSTARMVRFPAGTGGLATVPRAIVSGYGPASPPPTLVRAVRTVFGRSARAAATRATEPASRQSTRKGRPASATGTTAPAPAAPAGPVTSETTGVASRAQPRRAHASDADDGAGWTSMASAPSSRTSVVPMPWNIGSPLASTTSVSGSRSARTSAQRRQYPSGHSTRSAAMAPAASPTSRSPSCRGAPMMRREPARMRRARAVSPSRPSQPMPTTRRRARVIAASSSRSTAA